jgi:hemoglobin/transferrin/lactoferrin receptor protein
MVTVNRILQELMDVPLTVNVITAEDIEREPYTSISEVLAAQPGIELDMANVGRPGAPRIGIRGDNNMRTLYVIDGVKAVDKDTADSVPLIDLSQVERIEIIKGPASVLYGSEAIGGVINIITKKGGTKPFGFSSRVVYDSSTSSANIQSAIFGNYNGVNYRVSGSGANVKNRKVPKNALPQGESATSHYKTRFYSGQLGYDWGNHSWSVQYEKFKNTAYYANGWSAYQGNTIMWFGPNDRDTIKSNLILRELSPYLSKLTVAASYQIFERGMVSDFNNPAMGPVMWMKGTNYSKQKQTTISGQAEWTLGDHNLTTGFDYEYDDLQIGIYTERYTPNLGDLISDGVVVQNNLGIYAQDEWSITDSFKATLGLRYSYISGKYKSREGVSFYDNPKKDNSDSNVVGSLGLVYRALDSLALRAQYSQGYRYPTVRQLYTGTAGHGSSNISSYPNPNLKPETSDNIEIGMRFLNDAWDVDVAVFYSKAKNFIQNLAAADNNGVPTYINGPKAKTVGAEFSLNYSFDIGETRLTPYGSATILRREMTFGPGTKKGQSTKNTGNPPIEGRVGLKLDMPLTGSHRMFGDLYGLMSTKSKSDISSYVSYSTTTATTTNPAWQSMNLTLGVRGGEEHKYNVSVALRNIFNQAYTTAKESGAIPEAAFHVVVSAGYEF